MSCGLTLQICLIIALSFCCRRWRFGFVNGQVSLAWSIVLCTQELYTRPHVLKERWHEERTGSRSLNFFKWIVRLVQGMYANARSRVHVGEGYSEEFEVKVGVHQGSVLSPLLFITVLEVFSREFCSGVPWEDLYADDLVIIAESLEECVRRLLTWKEAMEKKGLRVNAGKTKIMICCTGLDLLQSSGEFPCADCRTGVGSNSIFCNGCKHWVHKKCSGARELHAPWMADHRRKSRSDLTSLRW